MIVNAVIIAALVIVNFILYLSFGTLLLRSKKEKPSLLISIIVGFFFYYFLFFFFCVPLMKYFRPLSMLTAIWVPFCAIVVIISFVLNFKQWKLMLGNVLIYIKKHKIMTVFILIFMAVQVILVSATYNFTLDAAYYVANVATSVETNMMNVYDPFTGNWLDHFEMRYFFATYSMQDAVVCQLTGVDALIFTKSVMAITIILLTNIVYFLIARGMFINHMSDFTLKDSICKGREELAVAVMMVFMFVINITFNTIYTSSLFLMTRTYEGKAIVGNLVLMTIFYLFLKMNDDELKVRPWLVLFIVCFGAATVSSSANMLVPVELTVLFVPLIVRLKRYRWIPKYILCVLPGVIFSLVYVLYVKGFFVFYTYPR